MIYHPILGNEFFIMREKEKTVTTVLSGTAVINEQQLRWLRSSLSYKFRFSSSTHSVCSLFVDIPGKW